MKNKTVFSLALFSTLALGLVGFDAAKNEKVVITKSYANGDADTYYNGVDSSSPTKLLGSLRNLNNEKHRSEIPYTSLQNYYTQTDPGTSSGQVTSFYSGKSAKYTGSTMNHEHVWPDSRGGNLVENDLHMPRPTLKSENASRGNSFFVEGMKDPDGNAGWDPAMETWGDETYRGDSARIIFYCVIASSELSLVDSTNASVSSKQMGKLSDLLKWNLRYPVSERERVRNEAAEKLQGNRNPFIDHPEYACRIWGDTNGTTQSICKSSSTPTTTGVTIVDANTKEELPSNNEYAVSDVVRLLPYYNGQLVSSASRVKWTLLQYSNSNPYKGDAVTMNTYSTTGVSIFVSKDVSFGLKLLIDNTEQARVKFKFGNGSEDPKQSTNPKTGCGGNITTTSVILSSLSILGLSILLIKRLRFNNKGE